MKKYVYILLLLASVSTLATAQINISVIIIHSAFTLLIVGKPHTLIPVVIHKIIGSAAVLLVLEPLPHILFSIVKRICPVPLAFTDYQQDEGTMYYYNGDV